MFSLDLSSHEVVAGCAARIFRPQLQCGLCSSAQMMQTINVTAWTLGGGTNEPCATI
jgi:hypothetical protein